MKLIIRILDIYFALCIQDLRGLLSLRWTGHKGNRPGSGFPGDKAASVIK